MEDEDKGKIKAIYFCTHRACMHQWTLLYVACAEGHQRAREKDRGRQEDDQSSLTREKIKCLFTSRRSYFRSSSRVTLQISQRHGSIDANIEGAGRERGKRRSAWEVGKGRGRGEEWRAFWSFSSVGDKKAGPGEAFVSIDPPCLLPAQAHASLWPGARRRRNFSECVHRPPSVLPVIIIYTG
jgi:hypothetical protein